MGLFSGITDFLRTPIKFSSGILGDLIGSDTPVKFTSTVGNVAAGVAVAGLTYGVATGALGGSLTGLGAATAAPALAPVVAGTAAAGVSAGAGAVVGSTGVGGLTSALAGVGTVFSGLVSKVGAALAPAVGAVVTRKTTEALLPTPKPAPTIVTTLPVAVPPVATGKSAEVVATGSQTLLLGVIVAGVVWYALQA